MSTFLVLTKKKFDIFVYFYSQLPIYLSFTVQKKIDEIFPEKYYSKKKVLFYWHTTIPADDHLYDKPRALFVFVYDCQIFDFRTLIFVLYVYKYRSIKNSISVSVTREDGKTTEKKLSTHPPFGIPFISYSLHILFIFSQLL